MEFLNKTKEFVKKFTPPFLLSGYHYALAFLGAIFYGFPSSKLKVIGVTGTNGKSTVVELISKILQEAGYKVAFLSSIKFKVGDEEWKNMFKMTMPGRFTVQKILKQAVKAKCHYAVLEVTSEGILQHRHKFIDFEAVVFTNLSPEHIERHGSFENYKKAKGELFRSAKNIHIVNLDDEKASYFLSFPGKKKFCYSLGRELAGKGLKNKNCKTIKAIDVKELESGTSFKINNFFFKTKLLGSFNVYNILAAVCLGLSQKIDLLVCQRALEKVERIPGRMEEVISQPFKVIVDYAVTPDALEKTYLTIKKTFSPKKTIAVFGSCGGGRDRWKRPILGKIAAKYCQEIIITNEDPYDEDPMEIINQVAEGAGKKAKRILSRQKAIRESLETARAGDIVIITGKGCEPWIVEAKGKKIPWDDRKVVRQEFEKLYPQRRP